MIKTPPEIGDHTRTFLKRVTAWICEITEYPGFRDWQHTRMQRVLTHHLDAEDTSLPDFHFDAGTLKKHQFVTSYIELIQAANFLRDTEFYFRRYPLGDLPITESDHIGYICDMLFSRIYKFLEKMKKCLNLKNNLNKTKIDIGKSIKAYEKTGNYILEKAEWASYHFQGVTGRC